MENMDFGVNQALVEELYLRFRENPQAVDETWRRYFEAYQRGPQARDSLAPSEATVTGPGGPAVIAERRPL
jgi:multifunctional 2-oxoglutarate metabolism enzyme